MSKCIIVSAGDFNEKYLKIEKEDYVIACDGGLKYIYDIGVIPDMVIGDMDSLINKNLLDEMKEKNIPVVKLPSMKDDTDTLAGLRYGLQKGYINFEIYGALGGRIDHTLANIQCLDFLKKNNANGIIKDGNKTIEMLYNEVRIYKEKKYGILSAFAFGGEAKAVTEKGLKYEVDNVTLDTSFPIGTSNEMTGREFSISVMDGKLLIYTETKESDNG